MKKKNINKPKSGAAVGSSALLDLNPHQHTSAVRRRVINGHKQPKKRPHQQARLTRGRYTISERDRATLSQVRRLLKSLDSFSRVVTAGFGHQREEELLKQLSAELGRGVGRVSYVRSNM